MKYLNYDELKANGQEFNDYTKNAISLAVQQAREINVFYPCEVLFSHSEQDGRLYYEYTQLFLKHDLLKFLVSKHKEKFGIYCRSVDELKNVSRYDIEEAKKKFKAPNQIGVLSAKKIGEWVKYWEQVYAELSALDIVNREKKEEFMKAVKPYITYLSKDGRKGEAVRNGIKFEFTIEEAYISQKISVYYEVDNNLQNFLKLSENKY